MRKISKTQRRYSWKDFLKIFLIFLGHFIVVFSYIVILKMVDHFALDRPYIPHQIFSNTWIIYVLIAAPAISAIAQIIYLETGNLIYKIILWLNFALITVMIPIIILVL